MEGERRYTDHNYELSGSEFEDEDAPIKADASDVSLFDGSNRSGMEKGAAQTKMMQLAQKIYESTPGIEACKSTCLCGRLAN